jgi:uridine kinase
MNVRTIYNGLVQVFTDQELQMIEKEFTYSDARRYNRNEGENIPSDCFTEQALDSTLNSMIKNASSKSIILAPFNSTKSHLSDIKTGSFNDLLIEKNHVMRFAARVRELD